MAATIMATTASGSTYVISMETDGVRWFRVPGSGSLSSAAAGWQATLPRVVPGERLLLGPFQSTPVRDVAFIPGPWVGAPDAALDAEFRRAHSFRSVSDGRVTRGADH